MPALNILVVEDDMIIAADISMTLTEHGYEVAGILPRGELALESMAAGNIDLVLMDIALKGDIDGIQAATKIHEEHNIPVIFLTANSDKATFDRAKEARPYAFLTKPFNPSDLVRAIEVAMSRAEIWPSGQEIASADSNSDEQPILMDDRIFVKVKDRMVKIFLHDILYVEADSNYCRLVTTGKEYLLSVTLKAFAGRINAPNLIRVHRSYMINLDKLEEVGDHYLLIHKKQIPVSKSYREDLMARLKTL